MKTTPREVIDSVVRSVCGTGVVGLGRLTAGGMNETYRVDIRDHQPVIVRIARQSEPWFTHEAQAMALARTVGVPTPEVLGVEHLDHDGELLSFSVLQLVPGRSLEELAGELSAAELERLVIDSGELLARLHSVDADQGMRHDLELPTDDFVARVVGVADEVLGSAAAATVERGTALLRDQVSRRPASDCSLAHGDWLPKHFLIDDRGKIVSVIDWEFTGPASPAFDLAHWEVSAGNGFHDRSDLLRTGYARVTDPDTAEDGWAPAFAVDFALEKLGWKNPAPPEQLQRCVDSIARYVSE